MKNLFLTSIAALFLATGTAHAEQITWELNNYKRCNAFVLVSPASGIKLPESDTVKITFGRKNLAELKAAVRFLEKCRIWVWDRNRQKAIYYTPTRKELKQMDKDDSE